ALPGARSGTYSNAQIDDYSGLPRSRYPWRAPLRLEVRARASHLVADLRGTAGFGFWNYPFTLAGGMPRPPESVWFFAASPPSSMALVPGSPGWGWKAQVVHAKRWGALVASLPTLGAIAWARLSGREHAAARWVRLLTGTHETPLTAALTEWHDYALE